METMDMEMGREIAGPDGSKVEDGLAEVHEAPADDTRDEDDGSCDKIRQLICVDERIRAYDKLDCA